MKTLVISTLALALTATAGSFAQAANHSDVAELQGRSHSLARDFNLDRKKDVAISQEKFTTKSTNNGFSLGNIVIRPELNNAR